MHGLTLQRLEVFRAIYEQKSVSAAARRLRLSQPTVSRHLRDFERALGLTLFTLHRGRLRATADADMLFTECTFLSDGVARIGATVETLRRGGSAPLSVAAISPLAYDILPAAVDATLKAFPDLQMRIGLLGAHDQIRAVREGRIDLGLAAGQLPATDLDVRLLGHGHFVGLVPRGHVLDACGTLSLEQVADHSGRVAITPQGPIGNVLRDALDRAEVATAATVSIDSLQFLPALAERLGSCTIADGLTAAALVGNGMTIKPLDPPLTFEIVALSRIGSLRRKAATAFIDHVVAALAKQTFA